MRLKRLLDQKINKEIAMTFDKLFASRPVNKQTALANSGGYTYKPNMQKGVKTTQTCPPILPLSPKIKEDLTGKKCGRITVVGYGGRDKRQNVAKWVIRCVCGNYEFRRSQKINLNLSYDRCQECWAIARLRRSDLINQFGFKKGLDMYDQEIGKPKYSAKEQE